MDKEIVVPEAVAHVASAHLNWGDLFKYLVLFEEVAMLFNGVKNLPVGGSEPVPAIKVQIGSAHYTWAHDMITRDS
jgi:hypothetical protein